MTAAAVGATGQVRRDPMAMLPFCGYHMGDYFHHWLDMRGTSHAPAALLPRQLVPQGSRTASWLWPGFGENMRVLEWIVKRCANKAPARKSPIGDIPIYEDFHLEGLDFSREDFAKVMEVDPDEWISEVESQKVFFSKVGAKLPPELEAQRQALMARLRGRW